MPPPTAPPDCLKPHHLDLDRSCLHSDTVCPDHIRGMSLSILRDVDDRRLFTTGLAHADLHRQATTVVTIWALMYYGHVLGRLPPASREPLTDPVRWGGLGDEPWTRLLRMVAHSMVYQDAVNTVAGLAAVFDHPDPATRLQVTWSMAKTAASGINEAAGVGWIRFHELMLYHLYGLHTNVEAERFAAVPTLVSLSSAIARDEHDTVRQLAAEMAVWPPARSVPTLRLMVSALGHILDPDGSTLLLSDARTVAALNQGHDLDGLMDWQDESLDPGRHPEHMTIAWIMRMATAQARGDNRRVTELFQSRPPDQLRRSIMGGLMTVATILGAQAAAQEQAVDQTKR